MPRNGTGTYVLPAGQPVVPGTTISSSVFNTFTNDISTALTNSIATDGQTPMQAALPMGNNKVIGMAAGSASGDAVNIGQLASGGAALLGRGMQVVTSIAQLQTLVITSASKFAMVTGYYQAGDGAGESVYWYDSTDTTSADNGGTIIVAADGGRWKLLRLRGDTTVRQHGAKGDGVASEVTFFTRANTAGPFVVPPGTYKISTNITITSQMTFAAGAQLSIDTGVVVTLNCPIIAGMFQIFSGLGTVVIGKGNQVAYPEWWGAGGGTGIDLPAIQKCINACRTNGVVTVLAQNYFGKSGDPAVNVYTDSPIYSFGNITINALGQSQCFLFNPGNYLGPDNVLPSLTGFNGDAIILQGTAFCRVKCPSVANGTGPGGGSNGVNFKTTNANPTSLDNKVEIFVLGPNLANGVVFTGSGSGVVSTIQGNEFYCNFITSCLRACLFTETAAGTNWDGQIVQFAAIDPAGTANALALSNTAATAVPRLRFEATTWIGGFTGSGAGWVSGKFDELDFRVRVAENLTAYSQMAVVGSGGTVTLLNSGSSATEYAATTTQGVANFNGGAPLTQTRFKSSITIPGGGLANNATLFAYAYSPFVSFISSKLGLQFTDSQGCILKILNTSANANEITIQIANVSGGTLSAGTKLTFYLTVG